MTGGPGAWLGQSRIGRIIALVILMGLSLYLARIWFFDRHTLTVEVIEAAVPAVCQRDRRGLLGRVPAKRDFVPADADHDYCGLVWTDHGPFKLPQTGALPIIQDSRAAILSQLREGCSFRVAVIGTGLRPTQDSQQRRKAGTIRRIYEALPCPSR